MSKRSTAELQPPAKGHNYDAVQRAEYQRTYLAERLQIKKDKQAANEKFKRRTEKNNALIKGLNVPAADTGMAFRITELRDQIANAENDDDRAKLERKLQITLGNSLEMLRAANAESAEEAVEQQLDFNKILEVRNAAATEEAEHEDDAETDEAPASKKGAAGKKLN